MWSILIPWCSRPPKAVYSASLGSYHTFFLIESHGVSIRDSQLLLVHGRRGGGHVHRRTAGRQVGRKVVLWGASSAPCRSPWRYCVSCRAVVLSVVIGIVMASRSHHHRLRAGGPWWHRHGLRAHVWPVVRGGRHSRGVPGGWATPTVSTSCSACARGYRFRHIHRSCPIPGNANAAYLSGDAPVVVAV